jgi:hypothetical protein
MMSSAQHRYRTSNSWVVEALVTSVPAEPVSQYAIRSGSSSIRCAAANCGVSDAATSWNSVLNGCCARPVVSYRRAAPSAATTRSGTPSVRESR